MPGLPNYIISAYPPGTKYIRHFVFNHFASHAPYFISRHFFFPKAISNVLAFSNKLYILKEFQIVIIILIIYCCSKFEDMRGSGTRAITSFFKKQPELDQSKAGAVVLISCDSSGLIHRGGCFDFL